MERLVKEIVAFASVSGVAALVALVLFNLLVHGPGQVMHAHALTAYFVASSLGMVISFTGTRKYAFAHRETRGLGGGTVNYVVVNTLSLGIPMACLWVSRNLLGESGVVMDNVSANIVGSTLATVFRYFAFKQFVFRRPVTGLLARRTEAQASVAQKSVQRKPSSSNISRSSGTLIPTTLWGSPVTPLTKAEPSPSIVNAPATSSGSPVRT